MIEPSVILEGLLKETLINRKDLRSLGLEEAVRREEEILGRMTPELQEELHRYAEDVEHQIERQAAELQKLKEARFAIRILCKHEGDPDHCIFCGAALSED